MSLVITRLCLEPQCDMMLPTIRIASALRSCMCVRERDGENLEMVETNNRRVNWANERSKHTTLRATQAKFDCWLQVWMLFPPFPSLFQRGTLARTARRLSFAMRANANVSRHPVATANQSKTKIHVRKGNLLPLKMFHDAWMVRSPSFLLPLATSSIRRLFCIWQIHLFLARRRLSPR